VPRSYAAAVRRLAAVVLVLGITAGCSDGSESTGTSALPNGGVVPVGFEQIPMTVTNADGTVCELCVWLADEGKRGQGLMGVTDLDGKDGMIFVYDEPVTSQFWMRNTPTPLDIAWFDADGGFVSSATMEPCLTGPDEECARYDAAAPFLMALEVFAGDMAELGIGPGSVAVLDAGPGCDDA
jgi:uncharacterized membrane protein (UPF0127 family)